MLVGWNAPRPTLEDYLDFERHLSRDIAALPGVSLLLYGSWVRGDIDVGRSDIDAALIFPGGVPIDRALLLPAQEALARALECKTVTFQVSPADIVSMRDGTFNTYNPSFERYFATEGRVAAGPDYRPEMVYTLPRVPDLQELRFNLRKARQGFLFALHDMATDYEQLLRRFNKTLDAVSRGSKQLLYLLDGELRYNRFSAVEEIERRYPSLDTEPLRDVRRMYKRPELLDKIYTEPAHLLSVWDASLLFFERLVGITMAELASRPRA